MNLWFVLSLVEIPLIHCYRKWRKIIHWNCIEQWRYSTMEGTMNENEMHIFEKKFYHMLEALRQYESFWIILNVFESERKDIYIITHNTFLLILLLTKFSYIIIISEGVFFLWREAPSDYLQFATNSSMARCSVVIDWRKFLRLINRFWWIRACTLNQQSELSRNMRAENSLCNDQCGNGALNLFSFVPDTPRVRE